MKNILILFSGGADSTYLVYKMLTETLDKITVAILCSEQKRVSGLTKNEIIAIQPLLNKLKTYRNFEVIYHLVDDSKITSWDKDSWFGYSVEAFANDFNNSVYDELMCGTTWEQIDIQAFKNSDVKGIRPYIGGQKMFSDKISKGTLKFPLIDNSIHENFNRWHLLKYMPENLFPFFIFDTTKKILNDKVTELMSKGYTAANLNEWRKENSLIYGGGKRELSFVSWIHIIDDNGGFPVTKGVATDGVKINFDYVTNKKQCIDWYSNIEYNKPIDQSLAKWNLGKESFVP